MPLRKPTPEELDRLREYYAILEQCYGILRSAVALQAICVANGHLDTFEVCNAQIHLAGLQQEALWVNINQLIHGMMVAPSVADMPTSEVKQ